MDIRRDFKEQYHAALAMLANCVELCPDTIWSSGTHPRPFWRIAFHTAYFAHLYLGPDVAAFQPWPACPERYCSIWSDVEPYELPEGTEAISCQETLAYIAFVDALVDPILDILDFGAEETGFPWYPGMSKLSHELLSLRHIQGHVGQLSEILMSHGIDTKWIGKVTP